MNLAHTIKLWKRAAARNGLFLFWGVIGRLPYSVVKVFMQILVGVGFYLTLNLKKVARETLEIAFAGTKTEKEIQIIIKECFKNLGKGIIELIYFSQHPQDVMNKFSFEGRSYLDEALSQGKGAIAVTAHFGNFALMQLAFAQFGYKTNVIIRKARDEQIAQHVFRTMSSLGVKPIYSIPAKNCVKESLKALRNNEVLFVLLDQNFGSGAGVFVDFFGRKAATGTGPVIFAERSSAPILLVFDVREEGDCHKVLIEPPIALEHNDDREQMLYINIAKITRIIERYIRQYPQEWGWMHRRWKSQPSGNDVSLSQEQYENSEV